MARHLVLQHLERVSGDLFEDSSYRTIIDSYARSQSGIYVLYSKNKLYYVGLASNLNQRLNQHRKDRHQGKWDTFSMYLTRNDKHIRELEALLHRVVKPTGNKQTGRLKNSVNLKRAIATEIKYEQSKQLATLLGSTKRKQTIIKSNSKTNHALQGFFPRATTLKGWYKGYEYTARVLKSGEIRYDDSSFRSPTGAAAHVCNRVVNGWHFWHYKDSQGDWARLKTLR